jgi:cytochrome c peroxidase
VSGTARFAVTGGRRFAVAKVALLFVAAALAGCSRADSPRAASDGAPVAVPLRPPARPLAEVRRARAKGIAPLVEPGPGAASSDRAAAGRRVFFDRSLGAISCTRCHDPARSGAGTPVPFGSEGRLDVPALVDLGAYARFGTTGAATKLAPYLAGHLAEVGGDPGAREIAIDSAHGAALRSAFPPGDGEPQASPTTLAARALDAFLASMVAPSRVDRFLAGDDAALTAQEAAGFDAFFARGCVSCHDGSAFGGRKVATLGLAVPWPGDAPLGEHAEWKPRRARRVASLRHVATSAPYFHEGAVDSLPTAVQLMAAHQLGVMLADDERDAIAAFLLALAGPVPPAFRAPSPEPAPQPAPPTPAPTP